MRSSQSNSGLEHQSYDLGLVDENDPHWKPDGSQSHCYACISTKLKKGSRHHCRLCGNIACKDCCPRICKKCISENLIQLPRTKAFSINSNNKINGTYKDIQYLCRQNSNKIRWKEIVMYDKTYYEPVYIINEDETDTCIIRDVIGDYYACHNILLSSSPKLNEYFLDSIRMLLHAFINRSAESSLSLCSRSSSFNYNTKNTARFVYSLENMSKTKKPLFPFGNQNSQILKRNEIVQFYPMLKEEIYKLEGFLFAETLQKMLLNNIQLYHYVSHEESPKSIPAYFDSIQAIKQINTEIEEKEKQMKKIQNKNKNEMKIIDNKDDGNYDAGGFRSLTTMTLDLSSTPKMRKTSRSLANLKNGNGGNFHLITAELQSFRTGYQELRKAFESTVCTNELKWQEFEKEIHLKSSKVKTLEIELASVSQLNEKYRQAIDDNAKKVQELKSIIYRMRVKYESHLMDVTDEYELANAQTLEISQSTLIQAGKATVDKNEKIRCLEQQIQALKINHSQITLGKYNEFHVEKLEQRVEKLEFQFNEKENELKDAQKMIESLEEKLENGKFENQSKTETDININNKIANDYNLLHVEYHMVCTQLLVEFVCQYRNTWDIQSIYPLVYKLLNDILLRISDKISKYEQRITRSLCKHFQVTKEILYQSFYRQWIINGNHKIFLQNTDAIEKIKNRIHEKLFVRQFLGRVQLGTAQVSKELHMKLAEYVNGCIDICWKMCIQCPILRFTPKTFNVDKICAIKYHSDLHFICEQLPNVSKQKTFPYILYYIWPIISSNDFHAIEDGMKIEVCLGNKMPSVGGMSALVDADESAESNEDVGSSEHNNRERSDDEESSAQLMIFSHDDHEYDNAIGDDESYYRHHQYDEEYDETKGDDVY